MVSIKRLLFQNILIIYLFLAIASSCIYAQENSRDDLVSQFSQAQQRYEEALLQRNSKEVEEAYKQWMVATDDLDRFDRQVTVGFWTPSTETMSFHNRFRTHAQKVGGIDLLFRLTKQGYKTFYTKQSQIFSSSNRQSELKDIEVVIFGTIMDYESKPIEGVELIINNQPTWSDSEGNYILKLPSVGLFDVGYQYDFVLERVRKFPSLYISDNLIDFGVVDVDTSKSLRVSITNTGHRELMITSVEFVNDLHTEFSTNWPEHSSVVLGIGQTRDIEIYFDAWVETEKEVMLRFNSNDPENFSKTIFVKGKVEKSLFKYIQKKVEKGEYAVLIDFFHKVIKRKGTDLGS